MCVCIHYYVHMYGYMLPHASIHLPCTRVKIIMCVCTLLCAHACAHHTCYHMHVYLLSRACVHVTTCTCVRCYAHVYSLVCAHTCVYVATYTCTYCHVHAYTLLCAHAWVHVATYPHLGYHVTIDIIADIRPKIRYFKAIHLTCPYKSTEMRLTIRGSKEKQWGKRDLVGSVSTSVGCFFRKEKLL